MRGADGLLINQENGEQFQSRLWNTPSSAAERETSAIIDNWKVLGAQIEIYLVPASLANDREHRARLLGGITGCPTAISGSTACTRVT